MHVTFVVKVLTSDIFVPKMFSFVMYIFLTRMRCPVSRGKLIFCLLSLNANRVMLKVTCMRTTIIHSGTKMVNTSKEGLHLQTANFLAGKWTSCIHLSSY